jgi:hypothetical protein
MSRAFSQLPDELTELIIQHVQTDSPESMLSVNNTSQGLRRIGGTLKLSSFKDWAEIQSRDSRRTKPYIHTVICDHIVPSNCSGSIYGPNWLPMASTCIITDRALHDFMESLSKRGDRQQRSRMREAADQMSSLVKPNHLEVYWSNEDPSPSDRYTAWEAVTNIMGEWSRQKSNPRGLVSVDIYGAIPIKHSLYVPSDAILTVNVSKDTMMQQLSTEDDRSIWSDIQGHWQGHQHDCSRNITLVLDGAEEEECAVVRAKLLRGEHTSDVCNFSVIPRVSTE